MTRNVGAAHFWRWWIGNLPSFRLTARGFWRPRLETTRSSQNLVKHRLTERRPLPWGEGPRKAVSSV